MNIFEAIKSGRPFKRPYWGDSDLLEKRLNALQRVRDGQEIYLWGNDILADDWAHEEKKIEITQKQLNDVLIEELLTLKDYMPVSAQNYFNSCPKLENVAFKIKKRLGF
jgi:hypothetical protein